MSIISDSMLRNNDSDRASAQYASSQPYSQTYSDEGSSNDNQQGLLERIFNGLGASSDWIGNNVEYAENSPVGQWIGNNVEHVENSPVGQAVSQTLGQALAPANSIFQNWPALLGLAVNAAVTPKDDDAYGGSLYNAGVNGAASTIGSIADLMHQDDLAAAMYTLANRTQDDTPVQAGLDWDYITNPHGLTRSVGNSIGSMVPLLPAAALAPESLVAAAGRFSPWLANGVRYGFTAIPEAMAEGGQTRREAIEDGLDHPDLRAFGTLAKNLPLLAASNTLEGAILGGGLGKALAGKAGEGVFSRVAKAPFRATPSALAEGLQNGLEEGLQQGIQNASVDKEHGYLPWNWTDDQWDAAKEGFFGALPLGGIGGARKAIFPGVGDVAAAPENGPDNTDPVAMAQLTGKNDDVPTADGVDVTNLDPQQYTQWYGEKLKSQGIDVPDATITVQTPKATGTTGGAKAGAGANVMDAAKDFMGQHMENGANGCVEAVTKIGARYNPFLADELSKGVVNVDTLVADAGDKVIPFDPNNLEAGDVIVYGDNDHVVLADGNGGYVGNSSSKQEVVQGGDYNEMGNLKPTKIIKTGNGVTAQNTQETAENGSAPAADLSSLPVGDIATAIAQNTGLPANFIWAQLSHESDGGNSKLAREDHNYGGVKGNDGEYLHFDNDQQFIDYMSDYYPKYRENGIYDAQTADQFAEALQNGGYFTADLGEYEGGMHRYLEQAGLSDSGTAGAPSEKQSTVNTMTQQQFGDMLNEKMIDFAGTNDDTVKAVFNDMSTSKDKALVSLFAPYMQDGAFANTAANREALVGNDGFKKAMSMFLSKHLSDYAPTFKNGRISFQQAEDALRPRHQVQAAQTAQAVQATQTPNIQTAASPKMEAAAIQNVLSSFVQGKKNAARTEQEANLFDDMLDADDHFIDTPKNRQTLLKNYGAQLQAYVDDAMTPSLNDRVNQAIEQAVQDKDLNRMNILTQAKQANDTAALEKLVGPQAQQHVDIAAMLTPTDANVENRVSSKVQVATLPSQPATTERQAPQSEVTSTVQANMPVNQAPVRMNNQQTGQQATPKKQGNVTPLPTQEAQQSEGVRITQPQPTIDEQNAQMDARIAEIKTQPLAQRKALGQQYLDTLRQNNVSFSEKRLAKPLMDGEPEALEYAQRAHGDLLNTITPAEAAAASQHAPRTIQAATTARLGNMVSEITSGNTYKNASPVGKLAYLAAASAHAKTVGADESARAIDSIIADVRKKAGFSGKGTTEGMTPEQKDEFYNAFYKQSLDDATAIRKEAKDEKPANLKSLDNTIEMFKQELANSKPTKESRKEVTHESTQSKNQQKPDEDTKNQDQHAKPEPRKAADTQREAEESEVSREYQKFINSRREDFKDGYRENLNATIEHKGKAIKAKTFIEDMVKQGKELGSRQNKEPKYKIYTLDGHDLNLYEYQYYKYLTGKTEVNHAQDSDNKKAADESGREETKHTDTRVPDGLSKEAQGVYTAVRDKLRTGKSERSRRAADVSAEILARHADAYAKAYSKATGKRYTAADYMRDKIGIDTDGNVVNDEKAKQFFQTAWHGSPHDFDQFDLGAIGTGEGAQVHGWGLYFAGTREVSQERYVKRLSDVIGAKFVWNGNSFKFSQELWDKAKDIDVFDEKTPPLMIALKAVSENMPFGPYTKLSINLKDAANTAREYKKHLQYKIHNSGPVFVPSWFNKFKYRNVRKNIDAALKILENDASVVPIFSGHLFKVEIPDTNVMLDEQLKYNEQPRNIRDGIRAALSEKSSDLLKVWNISLSRRDLRTIMSDNADQVIDDYNNAKSRVFHFRNGGDRPLTFAEYLHLVRHLPEREANHIAEILSRENGNKDLATMYYQIGYSEEDAKRKASNYVQTKEMQDNAERNFREKSEAVEKLLKDSLTPASLSTKTGKQLYDILTVMYGHSQRDASLALLRHGVKGITYVGGMDGRCYVVFDDKAIDIINKYDQMANGAAQGYTSVLSDGKRLVSLLDSADESTFLHEMGHVFLLDLQDLAEVDQTAANDMAAVEGWATWKQGQAKEYKGTAWEQEFSDREKAIVKAMKDGDDATASQLKDEWAQERFARGFERYLESGEAPSSKLKAAFEKFKQFLTRIYNAFKSAGGKPSEDVKNIMARMMDSDVKNTIKVPPMGKPIIGRTGNETTVTTDSGKTLRVRYRLVPTDRVITSHDAETMTPNKAYPQELQPRDRQRVSMQEQVTTMANELRPADLGAGRNLNQGAPIIRKDGVVLNGNGRAMAIQKARAMKGKSATAYNKYLAQHAREFGFTPDMVMGLQKPMLVREVVDDIDANTMQDIINSTVGGSRMGASEQAKADAKKIKPRDLDSYVDNEQGDLTTAANQNFVANILYRIVGKNERNAYTDERGNVNADGIQRVKRALFSLAYDDDGLIGKMAESTDDNIRNVSRGLMSAAPAFARVNLAVKDGQAYQYDAAKTISGAVKHLDALRREGKPVKDYLNEQSMFSDYQDSDEVREVLRFLDDNKRSGKKIGIFLNHMANSIMEQGSPNQTSLMDGGRATLGEIIDGAERVARDGTTAASLFDNVQEAPTKAKENTTQAKDKSTAPTGETHYSAEARTDRESTEDTAYMEQVDRYQNAATPEEKQAALKSLQDMVRKAAEDAGFTDAVPEQTVAYKTRTKAAPRKTVKVYKVFTVSPDGSPTALFIGGTEKLPQGVWLDAQPAYHFKAKNGLYYVPSTKNPYTKGGKTGATVEIPNEKVRQELIERGFLAEGSKAQKVTALAYRPGWHAGTLPFFPQGGMRPPKGMNTSYKNIHRYNQVVFECELAADKDYTHEAEQQPKARNKDGSLNTKKADLQYLPENGYYYYATNPMTHGHPELGLWAISGSLKINRALTQEECDDILKKQGMEPQPWEGGKMNLEDLGYHGAENDAARKTLAPITYDDGNVIPLSQRFNREIDDIRYSAKQNDAQVKRSLQAVVDEAKKAFPNAKNIRQDGGHISMDMPNSAEVQINVVPSIEVNNEEAGRARAAHGFKDDVRIKINGGERTVGRTALIELSQLGRKGTAYHEAFHAVYDMCLTNEEKAALHKAYDKEAKAKGRDVYEVMADKYRDWMLAQQKGQHTLFGKLWQKVKSAVIRLLHLIRGADNARDVFRKVGSGEVWERQLNSKDSGNRYLVTNDQIRPDTEVPIIDVTDEPKVNVNNHHAAADIARSMIGKTFRIIGSDGYGKIASVSDGTHFVHSSNNPVRFDKTRRKALSVAEKILGNCVYIEKHGDLKHGTKQSYIEMFSVVKDGNRLVRFRIVAKEGNKDSHAFRIGEAKFYDIIKDGALQESGVLRHYKHEGTPSTLTIAELLKGVKDREGHLYVNKDGSLNYDIRIFHNGEEQGGSPSDVRNSADLFAIRPGEPIRYSLDANDNSKPSLFTRAYNHLTGRKNAASHDKNVKAMLEDITKMRIRFGKLDPKTETVFKKFEGVIRARNANEWEKVLPEAGRAIADRLNLKPSEDMNNYIAKWLLDEATNDTSQEASDFAAALKNDPVLSDQLVDLKTLFNERNNREADEVVRDAIQYEKPKERTTLTKAWETFYDEMIEELGPVKRMVKRVQEKSGQELATSVNPYIALRLFRGNAGRAMTMIEGQSEAAVKALQTNYPGVNFNGFKTLHMILDECGALHNEKRMKDFLAFALACHVKDIHTLNNRLRKSQQRLRDKIADLNDKINNLPEYQQLIESDKKVDDKYQEQREAYQKEIEGYQAKIDKAEQSIMEVPHTEDGLELTEDRCNKVMMKYMKEYGEAQQDLVHFSKVTTSILYDAGVISKKRYKELQKRWPNYIPMFRVFEDNEDVDFGDSLKHMHGSTRRIINPLDSIIRNTYDFVKKAEKNKARQLLANLTRISDVGEYIEEVDNSKPNDKTTITFYEDGKRKYLQTDPDIVKVVNNMGRAETNLVLRLLHAPAKIARACFTTINPSFALRNLIRDSTDASIYSKYGFKPWDFVRGFLHAVHRDELFYEWLSSGAAQASAISLDRDYTQATLNQMSKTWKERLLSKEFLPAILEGMQMVSEYSEYGTRIAAYERAKKKLAGENGPHPAAYDLASAALESRDLMDFARGGRGSRYLNNVVVFANASIQGFDKFFRTFDFRKPYRKESMKALARLFLCGMLPALLLAGIHSGDDWWEELPDWQKETNWILGKVGNTIIRIPKGQDIGLRFFSNLIEKAMDRSKHKAGDYFKPVWDSLPDMIPTALLPIIEATANHSYFTGAPVVPKYQEKLPAYLQFGNETSSFAKFVGKVIGVSPRKVEHVLFGYTGNMGKGLLGVYDTIVGNQSLNTNLNEAPVISGFTAIPYKQSKTVNDFYDKFDEQQRLNEEFKLTKKKPDGYDPALYKRMTKAQQELSKINKQERAAIDDPKMDSGIREQKQLGYQQQRLSVVRRVMGQ